MRISTIGLFTINLLIVLLCYAMVICACIVTSYKGFYSSLLDKLRDTLIEELAKIGIKVDTSSLTLTEVMPPLANGIIGLAVIIGSWAYTGCIFRFLNIKSFYIMYTTLTLGFYLVQVAMVIVVYNDKSAFDDTVKPRIKETFDPFSGIEGTDSKSLLWNSIMAYEKCCGIDSYEDFRGLKYWPPSKINNQSVNLMTLVMCCKVKADNFTCAEKPNESNNWLNTIIFSRAKLKRSKGKGCYNKLFDLIVTDSFVITVFALLLTFQFISLFFTIWTLCGMENKIDIV